MKKRIVLIIILMLSMLFFSACNLFRLSSISDTWKGTINITDHNSAMWFENSDDHVNDGKYDVEINFNFDMLSNPNRIIGGTLDLSPIGHDASERTINNPPYLISSGEFTVSDNKLSFDAEIVSKKFTFEGTVTNRHLTNSLVKEMINDTLTIVGSIAINEQ